MFVFHRLDKLKLFKIIIRILIQMVISLLDIMILKILGYNRFF